MMITYIAFFPIFGKPLIMYLGILTLFSFFITASIAVMNVRYGINKITFKWHPRMAKISLALGAVHGLLSFLALLGL